MEIIANSVHWGLSDEVIEFFRVDSPLCPLMTYEYRAKDSPNTRDRAKVETRNNDEKPNEIRYFRWVQWNTRPVVLQQNKW